MIMHHFLITSLNRQLSIFLCYASETKEAITIRQLSAKKKLIKCIFDNLTTNIMNNPIYTLKMLTPINLPIRELKYHNSSYKPTLNACTRYFNKINIPPILALDPTLYQQELSAYRIPCLTAPCPSHTKSLS